MSNLHESKGTPSASFSYYRSTLRMDEGCSRRSNSAIFTGYLIHGSGAPFFGEYQPVESVAPVRDYHTIMIVYANPIEPSDYVFRELKSILKKAPLIPQEEILVERAEVSLI